MAVGVGGAGWETLLTSSTYCSSPSDPGGGAGGEDGEDHEGPAAWGRAGPSKRKARRTRWGPWIGRLNGGGGGRRRLFGSGEQAGIDEEEGPGVLEVDAAAAAPWMIWGEGLGGGEAEVEGSREEGKGASLGLLEGGGGDGGGKEGMGRRWSAVRRLRLSVRAPIAGGGGNPSDGSGAQLARPSGRPFEEGQRESGLFFSSSIFGSIF